MSPHLGEERGRGVFAGVINVRREMIRITPVVPKCDHVNPYIRGRRREVLDTEEKEPWGQTQERWEDTLQEVMLPEGKDRRQPWGAGTILP